MIRKNRELLGRAEFAAYGTSNYPDATFTLRLTYGTVKGWVEGGRPVNPVTIIGGAFERHTGRDPFALPDRWIQAKQNIDHTKSMNFVSTNDIIGGNSGSPVLNKDAEIIGIIFDGNIHALGGAFWFDEARNRAVSLDSEAILEDTSENLWSHAACDRVAAECEIGKLHPCNHDTPIALRRSMERTGPRRPSQFCSRCGPPSASLPLLIKNPVAAAGNMLCDDFRARAKPGAKEVSKNRYNGQNESTQTGSS